MGSFKVLKEFKDICPICADERIIEIGVQPETLIVKKEPIHIKAEVRRCNTCGEIFASGDQEEANFQKAYRLYRDKKGLLQPEEITEIREQYGIGQRNFSLVLGWGEVTIHRYESGALQDEGHNQLLLLVREPKNLELVVEKRTHHLPKHLSRSVVNKLLRTIQAEYKVHQETAQDEATEYQDLIKDAVFSPKAMLQIRYTEIQKEYKNKFKPTIDEEDARALAA